MKPLTERCQYCTVIYDMPNWLPQNKKDCQCFRIEPQIKKIKSRKPKKAKACHAIKIYYSIADKQRNGAGDKTIYYIVVHSVAYPKVYAISYK